MTAIMVSIYKKRERVKNSDDTRLDVNINDLRFVKSAENLGNVLAYIFSIMAIKPLNYACIRTRIVCVRILEKGANEIQHMVERINRGGYGNSNKGGSSDYLNNVAKYKNISK